MKYKRPFYFCHSCEPNKPFSALSKPLAKPSLSVCHVPIQPAPPGAVIRIRPFQVGPCFSSSRATTKIFVGEP